MSFEDLTQDQLYKKLCNAERERDAKGPKHRDYEMACIMVASIEKAISRKRDS